MSDVDDPAIPASASVVRRPIGHEHDLILNAGGDALVEVNGGRTSSKSIRHGGRIRGYPSHGLELHVWRQCVCRNLGGRGKISARIPAEHLDTLRGGCTQWGEIG